VQGFPDGILFFEREAIHVRNCDDRSVFVGEREAMPRCSHTSRSTRDRVGVFSAAEIAAFGLYRGLLSRPSRIRCFGDLRRPADHRRTTQCGPSPIKFD